MVSVTKKSKKLKTRDLRIYHQQSLIDICKEWFKSRDTIRAHMNYVHVQGPQGLFSFFFIVVRITIRSVFYANLTSCLACPICGKISANRKALRKHQTIHMDSWKDRYKCIICGRGFRDSTKLKVSLFDYHFQIECSSLFS